jgi:hypothetical protein
MGIDPRHPAIVLAKAKGLIVEPQGASLLGAVSAPGREVRTKQGADVRVAVLAHVRTPNPLNGRVHWRTQSARVKAVHAAVWSSLFDVEVAVRETLALGCVVTLTRLSAGTVDSDNLQACLKPARDTVAAWMLNGAIGEMDSDPRITWEYGQEKTKRGVQAVRVEIEPRAT